MKLPAYLVGELCCIDLKVWINPPVLNISASVFHSVRYLDSGMSSSRDKRYASVWLTVRTIATAAARKSNEQFTAKPFLTIGGR